MAGNHKVGPAKGRLIGPCCLLKKKILPDRAKQFRRGLIEYIRPELFDNCAIPKWICDSNDRNHWFGYFFNEMKLKFIFSVNPDHCEAFVSYISIAPNTEYIINQDILKSILQKMKISSTPKEPCKTRKQSYEKWLQIRFVRCTSLTVLEPSHLSTIVLVSERPNSTHRHENKHDEFAGHFPVNGLAVTQQTTKKHCCAEYDWKPAVAGKNGVIMSQINIKPYSHQDHHGTNIQQVPKPSCDLCSRWRYSPITNFKYEHFSWKFFTVKRLFLAYKESHLMMYGDV